MIGLESFYGKVETKDDALKVLELWKENKIKGISRRLYDDEKKKIRSGSVFVYEEKKSGIRRWTDGMIWSPSRTIDEFLIYRELICKTEYTDDDCPNRTVLSVNTMKRDGANKGIDMTAVMKNKTNNTESIKKGSFKDGITGKENTFATVQNMEKMIGFSNWKKAENIDDYLEKGTIFTNKGVGRREKAVKKYYFKPNGLIKKTITCHFLDMNIHLVCYFSSSDFCALSGNVITIFNTPSSLRLSNVTISNEIYIKNQRPSPRKRRQRREIVYPGQTMFKITKFNDEEKADEEEKKKREVSFSDDELFPMFYYNKNEIII
eukprot:GHVP01061758.1.p1 GENE.GHVP01061758.1~~GHVP01061758.1.p1  ORF type:complete len:320 (+),score=61.79 GHVP01061758.1:11-970(+)